MAIHSVWWGPAWIHICFWHAAHVLSVYVHVHVCVLQVPLHVCSACAKLASPPRQPLLPVTAALNALHHLLCAIHAAQQASAAGLPASLMAAVCVQVEQSGLLQHYTALLAALPVAEDLQQQGAARTRVAAAGATLRPQSPAAPALAAASNGVSGSSCSSSVAVVADSRPSSQQCAAASMLPGLSLFGCCCILWAWQLQQDVAALLRAAAAVKQTVQECVWDAWPLMEQEETAGGFWACGRCL